MLVLVDGVDLTGKSTLVTRLANETKPPALVHRHLGPPTTGSSWAEYGSSLSWYKPAGPHSVIVDRTFLSEYVWPRLWGRASDLTDGNFDRIARYLDDKGAVHVHAMRDRVKLRAELEASDEPLRPWMLDDAMNLYDKAYGRLATMGCLVLPWDYEVSTHDDYLLIINEASGASQRAAERRRV